MIKQWNFILDNRLITVYDKSLKQAEKQAVKISNELKKAV